MERNRDDEPLRKLSEFYHATFSDCRFRFLECGGDLPGEFRKLRDEGCLEIMATAATHGLLPLLQPSPEAVRAQVLMGGDVYRATFGAIQSDSGCRSAPTRRPRNDIAGGKPALVHCRQRTV